VTVASRYVRAKPGDIFWANKMIRLDRCRELSVEALETLGEVVRDPERIWKHRISAAKAVLIYSQWREEQEARGAPALLKEIFGSDEKLLAWIEQIRPLVSARVGAKKILELEPSNE
jgi:hypothetical protein